MSRIVRVVTDVAAVDRGFDYLVPDTFPAVGVGDRVRMNFNGRSVRGWVAGEVAEESAVVHKPLVKWLGYGPPDTLWELLEWAAWRWTSPLSRFLLAASPARLITSLPVAPPKVALTNPSASRPEGVWHVGPTHDPIDVVLGAYEQTRERDGSLLVLVPTEAWAQRLRGRLEQRGVAVAQGENQWDRMRAQWPVIIGARGTALAPTPRLAGAVVIDADDDSYRSEASPTWNATEVVRERCRRDSAPFWATTVLATPSLLSGSAWHLDESAVLEWPTTLVVDRRNRDPHEGVLTEPAVAAAREALAGNESVAVVVILQRLGTGRLFACRRCGDLARCVVCQQPELEAQGQLTCAEEHERRENFCRSCAATNLRRIRVGVTTLARDVAAQLGQPVTEITAASVADQLARVVVGTEAVFSRVRRAGVVIFVDFDQYLLAPRANARHGAVSAVVKAARLVGRAAPDRRVVVQTRRRDEVIEALENHDVSALRTDDDHVAQALGLPPYGGLAELSGEGAPAFVASLSDPRIRVTSRDGVFTLRAASVAILADVLATGTRSAGRLRLAVQ
jgi:primosomal protein N' (replication factor Y)